MSKFVIMQMGFEKPSPEDMQKWMAWFGSIKEATVEMIGFSGGKEISHDGTADLGWDANCITGMTIIEAADMDAAVKLERFRPA
jgi:hypothetical protein